MLRPKPLLIVADVPIARVPLARPRDQLVPVAADAGLAARAGVHVAGRAGGQEEVVGLAHGVGADVVEAVEGVVGGAGAREAVVELVDEAVDGHGAVEGVEGGEEVDAFGVVPGEGLGLAEVVGGGPGFVEGDDAVVDADGFPARVQEGVVGDVGAVAGVVGPLGRGVAGEFGWIAVSVRKVEVVRRGGGTVG